MSQAATVAPRATRHLAQHLGEAAREVHVDTQVHDRWAIIDQGILVAVHIRRWRGETQLSLDDLGLTATENPQFLEALQEQTVLGRKRLLPKDLLDDLKRREQRGRALVERYSFNIRAGSWIPFTVYATWRQENEREKAGYLAAADRIVANYDALVRQVVEMYRRLAAENFDQLRARGAAPEMSRGDFIEAYVGKIRGLIPGPEAIRASFAWEERLDFIPMPATIEQDLRRREQLQARRAEDEAQADRVRRMNQDLADHARRQKQEQIDGMLGHLRRQMLERIYEVTAEIGGKLKANPAVSGSQIHSLRTLVAQVSDMNFLGDPNVDAMIGSLEHLLDARAEGNGHPVTPQEILSGLDRINRDIRDEAGQLLSRRGVRSQMRLDPSGQDLVFGRRVSRLRRDLKDDSIPLHEVKRVGRAVRDA